jgi:glycosyltransferase involved in cell wall biosynthesis
MNRSAPSAGGAPPRVPRVLVVQRRLTHYRIPFFESLRRRLADDGIELVLAHGQGTAEEDSKADVGHLEWALPLPTRYLAGGRICWQPFTRAANGCELVVITLENKLVCNLAEQFRRTGRRVALWGHGANLQGDPRSWRERFKRRVARQADWWFGYTQLSMPLIAQSGFPAERVTILNNAVDTSQLRTQFEQVDPQRLARLRESIGLAGGAVGAYVGSLYEEKRLPFLLAAAQAVRARVPGFELIVVGSGPQAGLVRAFCAANPWAHYLGPRHGQDKVDTLALADVMLNPGLVGLGILDGFICEVPMVTTDCGLHSPEIAYLESGVNGVMTADDEAAFVDAVVRILAEPAHAQALRQGCADSARRYTVDEMAERFSAGVRAALAAPPRRFGQAARTA